MPRNRSSEDAASANISINSIKGVEGAALLSFKNMMSLSLGGCRMGLMGCPTSLTDVQFMNGPNTLAQSRTVKCFPLSPMNTPRKHLTATVFENSIIVAGGDAGLLGQAGVLDTMEVAKIPERTIQRLEREHPLSERERNRLTRNDIPLDWKLLATPDSQLNTPRAGHAAVLVENRFWILIGGYNAFFQPLRSVEVWDLHKLILQQECPNLYSQEDLHCSGPTLNYERQHVAACEINGNRIIVVGGQNTLRQWHDTMEIISFNPYAESVDQVFCRPSTTTTTTPPEEIVVADVAAGSTMHHLEEEEQEEEEVSSYDCWKVRDERITITHCTGVYSLCRVHRASFLAMGKFQCQMITLLNEAGDSGEATTATRRRNSSSRFTADLKDSREFYQGRVVYEVNSSLEEMSLMLIGGRTANSKTPALDFLPLPRIPHGRSIPPFPSLPRAPSISGSRARFQLAWQDWKSARVSVRDEYLQRLNRWRQSRAHIHDSEIAWRRNRVEQLLTEIQELEQNHEETQRESDTQVSTWLWEFEAEIDRTAANLSLLANGLHDSSSPNDDRRDFPPPVPPPHTLDRNGGGDDDASGEPEQPPANRVREDGPPLHLCCPITLLLMKDPVIAQDGWTYDRGAILQWWRCQTVHGRATTSPVTKEVVTTALIPNFNIKSQCAEWAPRTRLEQQEGRPLPTNITIDENDDSSIASLEARVSELLGENNNDDIMDVN